MGKEIKDIQKLRDVVETCIRDPDNNLLNVINIVAALGQLIYKVRQRIMVQGNSLSALAMMVHKENETWVRKTLETICRTELQQAW